MDKGNLDRIYIRDLHVRCILGVYDEERREKQDVLLNLTLFADLREAGQTDRLEDTVDYKGIKKGVLKMVQQSECFLVEKLAQQAADIALESPRVQRVIVSVDKPGALRFARSVAVEITRSKSD